MPTAEAVQRSREKAKAKRDAKRAAFYNEFVERDGEMCAICHRTPGEVPRLVIDHDHVCCKEGYCEQCARGLLCDDCNYALGCFNDDIERLRAAITYLTERDERSRLLRLIERTL